MSSAWRAELFWLILLSLLAIFLARWTGEWGFSLWLCTVAYLGRHVFYADRLLNWLRGSKGGTLPGADGVWEELYYLIFRVRRRNKRRKKQLIRLLNRFRTATAALPDATVVLGPRDQIDWFNAAAARLLGLRKVDVGQPIGNLVRYPRFAVYLRNSDANLTINIPSPADESINLELRIVPYGEDSRLLIAQDVTQLRFMERVRSDFIANVSHELRTPLTVMKGYIEACADAERDLPEHYRRMFRRIEEQTARMQNLIDGLLALTRLESNPQRSAMQRVGIGPLLRSICEEAEFLAEDRPKIDLELQSEADVSGTEQELRSAFSNLVVNAVKYTPMAGRVIVRWRDDVGGACLDVEDNGPGIAAEHLPRLTERFYRVGLEGCRNKTGTGLGLAIVKHVLARHGASLRISSTVGKGSCFTCFFPEDRVVRPHPAAQVGSGGSAC